MKQLSIVKAGGKIIENRASINTLIKQFINLPQHKVLVHGGSTTANALGEKMGIPPIMFQGRRITDKPTLDLVTMVYAGLVNKNLIAQLQAQGCNALGLTGADLNLIRSEKRPVREVDYGFAGDVKEIDLEMLLNILQIGITPVFCAITHDKKGQLLNTNADTISCVLASRLSASYDVDLVYVFEKKGVLENPEDDHSLIPVLDQATYQYLRQQGQIKEGMLPKLDNGFQALQAGASRVIICQESQIGQENPIGTILKL
ncbi:MAG: acetylglutamate kinase [Bacteroidota bacterium]